MSKVEADVSWREAGRNYTYDMSRRNVCGGQQLWVRQGSIAQLAAHEMESLRNVRTIAINRTRSPSRTCGSVTTGVHG
jgi:hypothetical protein